jgi:hypothetical protein
MGLGLGVVGGLFPSPLHLIALSQVALKRWARATLILLGPPLLIDSVLLVVTLFFYRYIPRDIAHYVGYGGGALVAGFGAYSLVAAGRKTSEQLAESRALTYASVSAAALTELAAPGTWIYWLTLAGPLLAEGRAHGYARVVPFFAGGLVGYYGAALFSVWVMAWGASLNRQIQQRLFPLANSLLIVLGISYLVRAYHR